MFVMVFYIPYATRQEFGIILCCRNRFCTLRAATLPNVLAGSMQGSRGSPALHQQLPERWGEKQQWYRGCTGDQLQLGISNGLPP